MVCASTLSKWRAPHLISTGEQSSVAGSDRSEVEGSTREGARISSTHTPRTSENGTLTGALTRMRASAQLETISVIGSRCARCREVLGPQDFYLEVSGVSNWDCLQCNDCGRVFGETVGGGARDSCVLMREEGGVGCVHCGDFRNFFPACARCGEPVTSDEDCCVSVPAATTYWHVGCFACVKCTAPLLFSDEDALWRIEPSTGMPICFYHSSSQDTSPVTIEEDLQHQPSPPPPSPASGFFGIPQRQSQTSQKENHGINTRSTPSIQSLQSLRATSSPIPSSTLPSQSNQPLQPFQSQQPLQLHRSHQMEQNHTAPLSQPPQIAEHQLPHPQPSFIQPTHLNKSHSQEHLQPRELRHQGSMTTPLRSSASAIQHCSGCGRDVLDGQSVLSVGGTVWHPGCLLCAHCHLSFTPSHRVISVNGKMYCREDFEKLFGVLCDRCHNLISPGVGYFNTGTKQFHTACLSCTVCDEPLSAGSFFVRNDSLLCAQHKNYALSSRTHSAPAIAEPQLHALPLVTHSVDSGEALCHSVAALIKTAKDILLSLDYFDKKEFVGLAKQLAMLGREYSTAKDSGSPLDPLLVENFNKAHEGILHFCSSQLKCPPHTHATLPTCYSLEHSRSFLLRTKIAE